MDHLAQKVSVSLPRHLINFVKDYKNDQHLRSDSEVVAIALRRLEKTYLENCYAQSAKEISENPALKEEATQWEKVSHDGLEAEDW